MLKARNQNNEYRLSWRLEDKEEELFCPDCGTKVIFVDAFFKVKHFRHVTANRSCDPEPESERHLQMKQFLSEFLSIPPEGIEVNLQFAKPDLLQGKAAIECQASRITLAKFIERSFKYHVHGYHVLWIFDEFNFMPTIMHQVIRRMYFNRVYFMTGNVLYALQWNKRKTVITDPRLICTQGSLPEKLTKRFNDLQSLPPESLLFNDSIIASRKINIARFADKYIKMEEAA